MFIWIALISTPFKATAESRPPIRIQIGGEPSTLDPARAIDQYAFGILHNVTLGLMTTNTNGAAQLGLAQSYSQSKDGLHYRFQLKPDEKWSDGVPITAEHVVLGFRHALNPKTAAPNADLFFDIQNAQEIFRGQKPVETLGVHISGQDVQIDLVRPNPILLMALTLPIASPRRTEFADSWSFKFPVTGDYRITAYAPADRIELEPHPYRLPKDKPKVIYKILSEETAALNLFESKYFDVVSTMTATEVPRFRKLGLIQTAPSTTVFFVSFNMKRMPFNEIQWRQAVASVLDRDGMVNSLAGLYEATTSFIPPSLPGSTSFKALQSTSAVHRVKGQLIKPRVRLAYGASAFTRVVAEKIQGDLKTKLHLDIQLEPMELKTLLARLKSDPPEMYILGLSALYNDPLNHLNSFASDQMPNFSRYESVEYAKLLGQLKSSALGAPRAAAASAAQKRLVEDDVVLVPILLRLQVFGVNQDLHGFNVNPFQMIDLKALTKTETP